MDKLALTPLMALMTGVTLQLILGRVLSRAAKGWLAFLSGLAALAGALAMLPIVARGDTIDSPSLAWDRGVPMQYHVDGLSLIFVLMATGIGSAILLYCVRYMEHEAQGTTRFYVLMLTFIAGLVNLASSANLLMVYLSWEVIGLCSYFLVGFWYTDLQASQGARKVLVMTHLPGYGLLAAILLLYRQTGSFLWTDPAIGAAFSSSIFLLMLAAAMAKSVLFPLHTWIPEAMSAPSPVSALLHSACYVKAGVYLVARLYSLSAWSPAWHSLVLALGCATMLVGAVFALAQTDLKRLLAFSTISQLGYIMAGLGLGTGLGAAAGLFYCLSHGLFKGTLFLCAGAVQHTTGTRDMRRLGGLALRMPNTARIWLIAAAALIGVPLTNGFVAKWLLLDAGLEAGQVIVMGVAWLVSIFTAFYVLKATVSVFYGELPAWLRDKETPEVPLSMQAGMATLAGLCCLFGIAPQLLMHWMVTPAVSGLGLNPAVSVSWLGLRTTSAGAQVTAGAGMVGVALLAGLGLYRLATPPKSEAVGAFTGGDPLPDAQDVMSALDFADMAVAAFEPVYRVSNPDPLYLALWRRLRSLAAGLDRILAPLSEGYTLLATAVVGLVMLLLVWIW